MSDPVVQGSHGSSRDQGYYPLGVQIYDARVGERMRFGAVGASAEKSHTPSWNQGGYPGPAQPCTYTRARETEAHTDVPPQASATPLPRIRGVPAPPPAGKSSKGCR